MLIYQSLDFLPKTTKIICLAFQRYLAKERRLVFIRSDRVTTTENNTMFIFFRRYVQLVESLS